MATEFGSNVTQVPTLQSAVTPQSGVAKKPVLLSGLSGLFEQAGAALTAKKEKDAATGISEFTKQQLLVADALDQGRIKSSAHARTIMRKNLLDAIDRNPTASADLIAAQAAIVGLPGGADIVKEGNEQEQLQRMRRESLVNAGVLAFDADDATFNHVDSTVRTAEESKRQHDMKMQTLDEELKMQNVTEGRRKQIEEEKEQATVDYIRSAAPAERMDFESRLKSITNDPNMTEADKVNAIDDLWNSWQGKMSETFGDISAHRGSAYLKPFEQTYQAYRKRASGETTSEVLKNSIDVALATEKASMLMDPDLLKAATANALFNGSPVLQAMTAGDSPSQKALIRYLANNGNNSHAAENPYVSNPADRKGLSTYLKTVTDGLNSGEATMKADASAGFTKTLDSLIDYEGLLKRDPATAIEVVNWMATPGFAKALTANPDLAANSPELREVLEQHYDQEVWAMVRREFTNNDVQVIDPMGTEGIDDSASTVNATGVVGVRGTASGVEFYPLDPESRTAQSKARQLNRDLKPVINNTLKAGAHLEGRTDYGTMWDEVSQEFLGTGTEDDNDGVEFSIKDFEERTEALESMGAPVGDVVDAGAGYTVVKTADGGTERRTGTRAWRNNNPGNIEYGSFARSQGAVGSDGRFAVFPSYEAGRQAKSNLLFESPSYRNKTIFQAISRYAPSFENDTGAYARAVANAAGVTVDTPMSSLSEGQRKAVLDAMERVEGFRKGKTQRMDS